jgi:hypothetical protein
MNKAEFVRYVIVLGLLKIGLLWCTLGVAALLFVASGFNPKRFVEFLQGDAVVMVLFALALGLCSGIVTYLEDRRRRKVNSKRQ